MTISDKRKFNKIQLEGIKKRNMIKKKKLNLKNKKSIKGKRNRK